MEPLFAFLARASAGIILFYCIYWLFLRNETFHHANRWYFIGALSSSVLLPLFPFRYAVPLEPGDNTIMFQELNDTFKNMQPVYSVSSEASAGTGLISILAIVYIIGAFLVLMRLLIQTGILIHLLTQCKIVSNEGIRIAENKKYNTTFSFFNIVFINPEFINQTDLPKIIAHEKVHIRECHWCDLVITELLTVIFWFNPFIWFFERSIKQNHEYLADKGVISMGYCVARYQILLINQLMGMQVIGISNYLNFALNKNRFIMMTKKETSKLKRAKLLVALPILAVMIFAFAEPMYLVQEHSMNINSKHELESQQMVEITGEVVDEHDNPVHGVSVVIKGTTTGTITGPDGKFELKVPLGNELVLSFVGMETIFDDMSDKKTTMPGNGKYQRRYIMSEGVFNILPEKHFTRPPASPPPSYPSQVRERPEQPRKSPVEEPKNDYKEVFIIVEEMPVYPGGFYELGRYVNQMEEKLSKEQNMKGKALIGFTIDESGRVCRISILEQDNDEVARGAAEIATNMIDWTPGRQRGKPVPVNLTLPVKFQ